MAPAGTPTQGSSLARPRHSWCCQVPALWRLSGGPSSGGVAAVPLSHLNSSFWCLPATGRHAWLPTCSIEFGADYRLQHVKPHA